ncbi:MAG: hypothetical protein AB7K68_10410 [Bacteriovoracia bacterium]
MIRLFLILYLCPGLGFAANDLVGENGKTTGAGDSKRSDEYEVTKYNNQLYREDVDSESTQANAFVMGSNVMGGCVGTNVGGRTDSVCAASPKSPECVGLSQALRNAANCLTRDGAGECTSWGADGFTMTDWMAFSSQYASSMTGCYSTKTRTDALVSPMTGLTEMASGAPVMVPTLAPEESRSGVSRSTAVNALGWKELSERFPDGSVYLGYENGEIMRRAFAGEPFAAIVNESPFVGKLDRTKRNAVEETLADPGPVVAKALEGRVTPASGAEVSVTSAGQSTRFNASGGPALLAGAQVLAPTREATPLAPSPRGRGISEGYAQAFGASAPVDVGARHLASIEKISPGAMNPLSDLRGPAVSPAPAEMHGISLFERVSVSYRKRRREFHTHGSTKAGDEIRGMGTPEAFRNL